MLRVRRYSIVPFSSELVTIPKSAMIDACPNRVRMSEILTMLPHRFPFLLIDRVVDYQPGQSLEAYKLVTANEHYIATRSHVFPPVLIAEALARATGILAVLSAVEVSTESRFFLIGLDRTSFVGVSRQAINWRSRFEFRGSLEESENFRAEARCRWSPRGSCGADVCCAGLGFFGSLVFLLEVHFTLGCRSEGVTRLLSRR